MASNVCIKTLAVLAFFLAISAQGIRGGVTCENLDNDKCAFAVSSSGNRCVLEKHVRRNGEEAYTCRPSEIEGNDKLKDWIESERCIKSCGLDRKSYGISSDSLLESRFKQNLCSPQCYHGCPNVVDLYFNFAAGEAIYGYVAPGPVNPAKFVAEGPVNYMNSEATQYVALAEAPAY